MAGKSCKKRRFIGHNVAAMVLESRAIITIGVVKMCKLMSEVERLENHPYLRGYVKELKKEYYYFKRKLSSQWFWKTISMIGTVEELELISYQSVKDIRPQLESLKSDDDKLYQLGVHLKIPASRVKRQLEGAHMIQNLIFLEDLENIGAINLQRDKLSPFPDQSKSIPSKSSKSMKILHLDDLI